MAKKCMIAREKKRMKLISRYAIKRKKLKDIIKNPNIKAEDKWKANLKLQQLPRDSSISRLTQRCKITGRSRGVYRKFGLSRTELRRRVMEGDVPGVKKASW